MKIYEIGTGYTPIPAQMAAATEIVVEELSKAFLAQNTQVEIIDISTKSRKENNLPIREVCVPALFTGTDVQLGIMHKLKRVTYSLALACELKKLLKKTTEKVVLHFHNQYNLFFFLKLVPERLRSRSLVAYTNHSGIWRLEWSEIEETIRTRYFQEAECMRRADLVFLLNEETKQNVMTHIGVDEKKIVLIDNGVNTEVYHPMSEVQKQKAKEKWSMTGKTVVLQVGSVYENKGQLRALEYLLPMLKESENMLYAYAGGVVDEAYHEKVIAFAKENGVDDRVRYLGMLSPGGELNELYNAAELTIFPSRYEAFGLVAIESLAAGVPVMIDEQSPLDFGCGSIKYNASDVLSSVYILEDEKEYMQFRSMARDGAVAKYSWNKIADDYLSAFRKEIANV